MSSIGSRLVRAVVLVGVLAGTLSGCIAESVGVTGVSVDADGAPVIVLAVCHDAIAEAGLLDTGTDGQAYRNAGTWTPTTPIGRGLTLVPVAAPPAGWVPGRPSRPLVPQVQYVAQGSTADNTGSTDGATFTVADLTGLTPGTVLYQAYTDRPEGAVAANARVPVGDFFALACG